MPPRKRKSTARRNKNAGISINIKNILKQVQNEKKPDNLIYLSSKKNPFANNLNNGNMSRLQVPAMSYASRPLSQFPSLASTSNIVREFAPPVPQMTSKSIPPLGAPPLVTPAQDRQNDVLEEKRPSVKIIPSQPIVTPTGPPPSFVPTTPFEAVTSTGASMEPRLASVQLDGSLGPAVGPSARDRVVALAENRPVSKGRGRPRGQIPPGEKGPYNRKPPVPSGLSGPAIRATPFTGTRTVFDD